MILYVLLVRVFGNLADKWYILIPFCWGELENKNLVFMNIFVIHCKFIPTFFCILIFLGFPIPLVAISAGLLHDDYISET